MYSNFAYVQLAGQQYIQWNLSKTATCGPVQTDLYREVAALQRYCRYSSNVLVLFWPREAGCFREVAA